MAEPPILTLADVRLSFGGDALFAGVGMAVQPGERIALVGRNGSGKSTLMKLMAGLVAPDDGAVKRSKQLADRLDLPLAVIFQRRVGTDAKEPVQVVGDVEGRTPILIEDIIDTAGTVMRAVDVLLAKGCNPEIYLCSTHPVFAGPAFDRLARPEIREVIVTNTIPVPSETRPAKITVLSAAPLLAEAIRRIHLDQSVSILFT